VVSSLNAKYLGKIFSKATISDDMDMLRKDLSSGLSSVAGKPAVQFLKDIKETELHAHIVELLENERPDGLMDA